MNDNYSDFNINNLPDKESARKIYKDKRNNNKPLIYKLLIFAGVFLLLAVLCFAGLFSACSKTNMSYSSTAKSLYKRSMKSDEIELTSKEKALDSHWKDAEKAVTKYIDKGVSKYCEGDLAYKDTVNMLNAFSQLKNAKDICETKLATVEKIEKGRDGLSKAKDHKIHGDYISAIEAYMSVPKEDKLNYKEANKKAKELIKTNRDAISYEINGYLAKYDIQGAFDYVGRFTESFGDSDFFKSEVKRIEEYEKFQTDLVTYKGSVEHVFTHCLIAFPELCYSSPSMTASLDEDCITPYEFIKIFEALYEKDYILIDINILVNEQPDGSVKLAELKIPKGKKPLVFSIDDVTYDSRKMHTGMVDKLIVDEKGMVCTYTLQDGKEIISYENEIFPIINDFVRKHPDFTFQGARGTLCHTGFDGLYGYRTQSTPLDGENVNREEEIEQAKKVAEALRNEGWTFASHSYGHSQMGDMSVNYIKEDTDNWIDEVTPIIGDTKVMVWPYGNKIREGVAHDYLYNNGFRIFCGVGVAPFLAYEPDGKSVFMDRKSLDGFALRNRREKYLYLFDTEEVWDPVRPKEETWK